MTGEQQGDDERNIVLAVIIGAHGVTGEVRLKLFGEGGTDSLKPHKSFNDGALTLKSLRHHKAGAIARFAEITDRNRAEAMRGTELSVLRSALPALDEDEYYHADLVGRSVCDEQGAMIGRICAVENFGAGDIIEIERSDARPFMVPVSACDLEREPVVLDAAFMPE